MDKSMKSLELMIIQTSDEPNTYQFYLYQLGDIELC